MRPFLALLSLACGGVSAVPPSCLTLSPGQLVRAHLSKNISPCFWVTVESGEAALLTAEQPVDLRLRAGDSAGNAVADGFEFGNESLTILLPGRHRIDVQAVGALAGATWNFNMSHRMIPLQEAELLRRTEQSASDSKRTGKSEDIAASLALWRTVGDASAIARTHLKEGDAAMAALDSLKARVAYEDGWRICSSIGDLRCTAEAANNGGYAAFLLGDLEGSSRRLLEASRLWRRLSLRLFEGRTLNNLGMMFRQSGDFEQAISALDEARRILRAGDVSIYAQVLNNLGICYQSLSENEKAIAYFQSSLNILLTQHQFAARVRLNLGRSYLHLGMLARAERAFRASLDEASGSSNNSVRADVLNHLAQVLLRLHRGELARASLEEALAIQKAVHSKRGEAMSLHFLGLEANSRGDLQTARQLLDEAARIGHQAGLRDQSSESLFALAELEYRAGNLTVARRLVGEAISTIEVLRTKVPNAALRATYYARKRHFFDLLIEITMAQADKSGQAEGFLVSEQARGRSVLDLIAGGWISGAVRQELVDQRTNLRHQIDLLSDPAPRWRYPPGGSSPSLSCQSITFCC